VGSVGILGDSTAKYEPLKRKTYFLLTLGTSWIKEKFALEMQDLT
jgi:hypothetical protein